MLAPPCRSSLGRPSLPCPASEPAALACKLSGGHQSKAADKRPFISFSPIFSSGDAGESGSIRNGRPIHRLPISIFFFFVISFYEACTLRDADESACNIHFAFVFQSFQLASVPCYCCGKADTSFFLIFCPRRVCCEKVSKQAAVWPFPLSTCRLSCV